MLAAFKLSESGSERRADSSDDDEDCKRGDL